MKTLIAYYSLEGNTEFAAQALKEKLNCDILKIEPIKDINGESFMKYIWGGKDVLMKRKPELKKTKINLNNYDTIYIGSPIWAGTFAPPIKTFLNQLEGKKLFYFYTHQGGAKRAEQNFKKEIGPKNTFLGSVDFSFVLENKEETLKKIKNI